MTRLISMPAMLLMLHGCAAIQREEQPWSFVTAVGGLELGSPVHSSNQWELPVRADVSGLHAVTNKPTTMNSGLVCDATKARIEGQDILLVVVTTAPHGTVSSSCPAAKLGALAPGHYNVLYGKTRSEGEALGTIDVGL
jgi:hypothetical protein